jgi:hypothetical protein
MLALFIYAVGHTPALQRQWDRVRGIEPQEEEEEEPLMGSAAAEAGVKGGQIVVHHKHKQIPLSGALSTAHACSLSACNRADWWRYLQRC